jgi:pSer/pThr/pTyr-binding forkhead associated (FHA) protein
MDGYLVTLWILRLLFLALLYGFLFVVGRVLIRDLRAASPRGDPQVGVSYPLDAVTTLGRDLASGIVIEDPYASVLHAVLTFRGRTWYIEDRDSTNGTWVNGAAVTGPTELGFGDEVRVGEVVFRLDRGRT